MWQKLLDRYSAHGLEYATAELHPETGQPINLAMSKDNLQDVEEELIDALFNALVYNFRDRQHGNYLASAILYCLRILGDEYTVRAEMEQSGSATLRGDDWK